MPALSPRHEARLALLRLVLRNGLRADEQTSIHRRPLHRALSERQVYAQDADALHAILSVVSAQGPAEVEDSRIEEDVPTLRLGSGGGLLEPLPLVYEATWRRMRGGGFRVQGLGFRRDKTRAFYFDASAGEQVMPDFMRIEDLQVYQKLCDLHLDVCDLTKCWPSEERFELGSQARRASNSAGAQLAEKHSDRHVRNKIEGVNRSRGEALETVHHLFMAQRKKYLSPEVFEAFRERYHECVRMLNGLERKLEMQLPAESRRFPSIINAEPKNLNPDP